MEEMSKELELKFKELRKLKELEESGRLVNHNDFILWLERDNTYQVEFCSNLSIIDAKIPQSYNGKPITKIGIDAFNYCNFSEIGITYYSGDDVRIHAKKGVKKCESLASVMIPDSITDLYDGNFTVWETGRKIWDRLLERNININIAESNPRYMFVNGGLYRKDDKALLCGGGNRSTFTVFDGTKIIAVNALKSDAIKRVVIPSSVRRLEHGIISLCHNVDTIFYKGTKSDWEKIDIDSTNDFDFKNKATVYFYSETPSGNSWHYAADGVTPEITHTGGTGFFSKILKKFGL